MDAYGFSFINIGNTLRRCEYLLVIIIEKDQIEADDEGLKTSMTFCSWIVKHFSNPVSEFFGLFEKTPTSLLKIGGDSLQNVLRYVPVHHYDVVNLAVICKLIRKMAVASLFQRLEVSTLKRGRAAFHFCRIALF
jgi:hypothetical protein